MCRKIFIKVKKLLIRLISVAGTRFEAIKIFLCLKSYVFLVNDQHYDTYMSLSKYNIGITSIYWIGTKYWNLLHTGSRPALYLCKKNIFWNKIRY